jgi:hypothetical protein
VSAQVDPKDWPTPLREGDDEVALLMRSESERRLAPGRPFFVVVEKRATRQLRNATLAVMGVAAGVTLWLAGVVQPGSFKILAEPNLLTAEQVDSSLSSELGKEPPTHMGESAVHHPSPGDVQAVDRSKAAKAVTLGELNAQVLKFKPSSAITRPQAAQPAEPTAPRSDCGELSRQGSYAEALECFRAKSEGQGTSAEIGFLEMARIQRGALNNSAAALKTLKNYQAKFPHGTLSPEAERLRQEIRSRRNDVHRFDIVDE